MKTRINSNDNGRLPAALLLLVVAAGIFYALTLRSGHVWGDDFAQYILHAANLAEGRGYADLPFIRCPFNFISPATYPPLVPVMLAPVYYLFGPDLVALKLVMVAGLCAALMMMGRVFSRDLPGWLVLLLLALFCLNPFVWSMKDRIQSEYFYILSSFLALFVIDRCSSNEDGLRQLGGGVLVGITMYFAYATREIGIVLLPALVVSELIASRKISLRSVVAVALFALLVNVQGALLEVPGEHASENYPGIAELVSKAGIADGGHTTLMHFKFRKIRSQVTKYAEALKDFWSTDHILAWALFLACGVLAIAGFIYRLTQRISVYEVYIAGYVAILLLFVGNQGLRYLVPIIPFYLFYAFHGIRLAGKYAGMRFQAGLVAALMLCAGIVYAHEYSKQDFGHIPNGIGMPDTIDLAQYLKTSTGPDDVIVFRKPRAIALLSGRTASVYPDNYYPYVMHGYLQAIGADYVVQGDFELDIDLLGPMIEDQPAAFEEVYRNPTFRVYRYLAHAVTDPGTEKLQGR